MLSKAEQFEFDKTDFTELLCQQLNADKFQDLIILESLKQGVKPSVIADDLDVSMSYVSRIKNKYLSYGIESILSDSVEKRILQQKRDVFIDKILNAQERILLNGNFEMPLKDVSEIRSKIYDEPIIKSFNKSTMRSDGFVRVMMPIEDYEKFIEWSRNCNV